MSETQQEFAYGRNEVGDCECPALAAGFDPSIGGSAQRVAEWYDNVVEDLGFDTRKRVDKGGGVPVYSDYEPIPENHAKQSWLKMIDTMEKRLDAINRGKDDLETAREIADELGWL